MFQTTPAPLRTDSSLQSRDCGTQEFSNYLVRVEDAKVFVEKSMVAVGTKSTHAIALANLLVLADQRGHYSHGLNRLGNKVDC